VAVQVRVGPVLRGTGRVDAHGRTTGQPDGRFHQRARGGQHAEGTIPATGVGVPGDLIRIPGFGDLALHDPVRRIPQIGDHRAIVESGRDVPVGDVVPVLLIRQHGRVAPGVVGQSRTGAGRGEVAGRDWGRPGRGTGDGGAGEPVGGVVAVRDRGRGAAVEGVGKARAVTVGTRG